MLSSSRGEVIPRGTHSLLALLAMVQSHLRRAVALVAQGFAWHFKRYSDDEDLSEAELAARRERRGLWSDPNPIPPWDWRKQPREVERDEAEFTPPVDGQHWLNTTTNVRHNTSCDNWGKTKRGRPCGADEGRACGICGG